MDTYMDISVQMNTFASWEEQNRIEIAHLYDVFFANNPYFVITYEEFAWYCYNHTS